MPEDTQARVYSYFSRNYNTEQSTTYKMESTEEDLIRYYHSLLAKSLTLLTRETYKKFYHGLQHKDIRHH